MAIANLKDDLTNSQVNKVITNNRQSTAAVDAKKRRITYEQLAKHNTKANCWMCVQGIVYDITEYVAKHPGGKIILEGAGKDATNLFSKLTLFRQISFLDQCIFHAKRLDRGIAGLQLSTD